jgi:hypothetical protein
MTTQVTIFNHGPEWIYAEPYDPVARTGQSLGRMAPGTSRDIHVHSNAEIRIQEARNPANDPTGFAAPALPRTANEPGCNSPGPTTKP